MEEIWKDVNGYEGFYQISNLGRLKSLSRIVKGSGPGVRKTKECIIKNKTDSKGYFHYNLSKLGIRKDLRIHRIIAFAFIPNPENKPFINHKNGIKKDNSIENLEWCTFQENMQHAYNIGIMTGKKGGDHVKHKKVFQYDREGNFIAIHHGVREAGRITGIDHRSIAAVAGGSLIRKSAGGYIWKYEE